MNIPVIKLHIYKNDVNDKPIEKIGNITIAHIEGMQDALNQNEDVTEYDNWINYFDTKTPFECAKYNLDCDETT